MARKRGESLELAIQGFETGKESRQGYHPVRIGTNHGPIEGRYYPVEDARCGAIWAAGAGGGYGSPHGMYERVIAELRTEGIASLQVAYRRPAHLEDSILDLLAGLEFLKDQGVEHAALTGWSFGGAVVIAAAAHSDIARAVVTVASQSYGADLAAHLPDDCSLLLLHGTGDHTLPSSCSEYIYRIATEPKELRIFPGANHGLDQAADEADPLVRDWIKEKLYSAVTGRPSLH
ncbi:MAG: dienelactone hydrolase family protein [Armatimonadetes bacterium]|nr:dienelactone hydrolase family protein [Armatimonadota bacterium]